ncbi:unnamed protein product [Orchesella dallaii]|uniref:Uncharacterized protein n=1 Tax=Orchesella dallaii TaxID=48710 RepID=A0ABP1QR14_9HEXA
MGATSSKLLRIRMPYRSQARKRHRNKPKAKIALALLTTTDTAKAIGDKSNKPDPYALPTSPEVRRKPRVWVVNLDDDEDSNKLSEFPSECLRKRRSTAEAIQELQRLEIEFKEFDVVTQEYPEADPTTLAKNRKFVIAWKSGLSHRLTKLGAHPTDIPVIATAFCKVGRSKWKDCCRSHIICRSKGDDADVEAYHQHISYAHATHHITRNVHGKVLFNSSIVSVEQREEREKRMAVCSQVFSSRGAPVSRTPYESNPLGSMSGSFHEGSSSSPIIENFVKEKRASLIGKWGASTKNENDVLKRNFSDSQLLSERKNVMDNKIELDGLNLK